MNNQNNKILSEKLTFLIEKYNIFFQTKTKSNKFCQFTYISYRFVCTFNKNNINIHIYSINNELNNIELDIDLLTHSAEINNVNKNHNNIINITYNPKNLIKLIIKICKILHLKYIILTDNSFFLCHGKKVDLNNFTLLKDNKSWYEKHFGFTLFSNTNDIQEYTNTLKILSTLSLQDVVEKVPNFINIISFQNNQANVNGETLLSKYLQKELNKYQCKILHNKQIIRDIFTEFHLLNLYGKRFKLIL